MSRYRRRPSDIEMLPGLFDEFEPAHTDASQPRKKRSGRKPAPAAEEYPDFKFVESADKKNVQSETSEETALGELAQPQEAEKMKFISFGSGSSGNCSYIGTEKGGILIDAGVDPARVVNSLLRAGVDMSQVGGIILTHDHGDHVRYAYTILRRFKHMRLYCTPKTLAGLLRRHNISRRIKDYHQPIFKEFQFHLGPFVITPFDVSHDGSDNCGFFIQAGAHNFTVATDMGYVTERADYYIRQSHHLMIEANYDLTMLLNGSYPEYLKARIIAEHGHMDNAATAEYLAKIYTKELRSVFLCHLSHDNNTPAKALETIVGALTETGVEVGDFSGSIETRNAPLQLMALPRFDVTSPIILRL